MDSLDAECYVMASGEDYRGYKKTTYSGNACLSWTSHDVQQANEDVIPEKYPYAGLGDHNYCRNPTGHDHPWCYYKKPSDKIEVEKCVDGSLSTRSVVGRTSQTSCLGMCI